MFGNDKAVESPAELLCSEKMGDEVVVVIELLEKEEMLVVPSRGRVLLEDWATELVADELTEIVPLSAVPLVLRVMLLETILLEPVLLLEVLGVIPVDVVGIRIVLLAVTLLEGVEVVELEAFEAKL